MAVSVRTIASQRNDLLSKYTGQGRKSIFKVNNEKIKMKVKLKNGSDNVALKETLARNCQ